MERAVGADMRLLYGMLVPILMICSVIIVLALSPAVWLVATILVLELGALAVVGYGLAGMLNEPADDDIDDREAYCSSHIAVGCDGSAAGRDAVALGAAIASATGDRPSLVGVFPPSFLRVEGVTDRKVSRE